MKYVTFVILSLIAVPWYWQFFPQLAMTRWLGMPSWVVGSVAASLCVSLFTAWLLRRPWPAEVESQEEPR